MSIIDPKQIISLSLLEIAPPESPAATSRQDAGESFNDYLEKARSSSTDSGSGGARFSDKDQGKPMAARPAELHPTASTTAAQNNTKDDNCEVDVNAADYPGITNRPEPENRQAENKSQSVDLKKAASQPEKKQEDKEKTESSVCDAAVASINQDNQPELQVNPDGIKTIIHNQATEEAPTNQTVMEEAPNPAHTASKDEKTMSRGSTLTIAQPLTQSASQIAGSIERDESNSPVVKGRASKKNGLGEGKRTETISAENQAGEIISDPGDGTTSTAKIITDITTSSRNPQWKNTHQNEKKEMPHDRAVQASVSPTVSQDAPAVARAINSAALEAAVNFPAPPVQPTQVKADIQKINIEVKNNSDVPNNSLQRPGAVTAKIAAGMSRPNSNETGSQLDRVRFAQRVERAFAAIGDRGGSVRLKLSPPELGSLRLEITVSKGAMKARIEAETPEAKNLLLENLPALRDRLAQQNIKIQQFDVDLMDRSPGGTPQQTAHQADTGSRQNGYRAPQPQAREKTSAAAPPTPTTRLMDHNGQLNVIV